MPQNLLTLLPRVLNLLYINFRVSLW